MNEGINCFLCRIQYAYIFHHQSINQIGEFVKSSGLYKRAWRTTRGAQHSSADDSRTKTMQDFSSENISYLITEARNNKEFIFFYIEYKKAVTSFLETLFACRGSLYYDLCWLHQYGTVACCAMTGRNQGPVGVNIHN